MRPIQTGRCTHSNDDWCDECFVPTDHLATLRALDAEIASSQDECVNARHSHGNRAYKTTCLDTAVPPYPAIHRIVGSAAMAAVIGSCIGIAAAAWLARRTTETISTAEALSQARRTLTQH